MPDFGFKLFDISCFSLVIDTTCGIEGKSETRYLVFVAKPSDITWLTSWRISATLAKWSSGFFANAF
jgi:hypothetical protein